VAQSNNCPFVVHITIGLENITTFENNGICVTSVLLFSDVVVIFFSSVVVLCRVSG